MTVIGSPILMNPYPANSMLVSIILPQEVTRPEARYKLILYEKSEVDQGDNQVPAYHS